MLKTCMRNSKWTAETQMTWYGDAAKAGLRKRSWQQISLVVTARLPFILERKRRFYRPAKGHSVQEYLFATPDVIPDL